jgi:hypothetical protein
MDWDGQRRTHETGSVTDLRPMVGLTASSRSSRSARRGVVRSCLPAMLSAVRRWAE